MLLSYYLCYRDAHRHTSLVATFWRQSKSCDFASCACAHGVLTEHGCCLSIQVLCFNALCQWHIMHQIKKEPCTMWKRAKITLQLSFSILAFKHRLAQTVFLPSIWAVCMSTSVHLAPLAGSALPLACFLPMYLSVPQAPHFLWEAFPQIPAGSQIPLVSLKTLIFQSSLVTSYLVTIAIICFLGNSGISKPDFQPLWHFCVRLRWIWSQSRAASWNSRDGEELNRHQPQRTLPHGTAESWEGGRP